MPAILASHRMRRRLLWSCIAAVALAGFVVAALALPKSNGRRYDLAPTGTAAPQTVAEQAQVPLAPAARRAIDDTVDAFVHSGVDRSNPSAAWALVTPAMRVGVTRAQWNAGTLPVVPFPALARRPGWTVLSSYPGDVTIDLMLHAKPKTNRGAIAFAIELKRRQGRWLVDSMVPEQVFGGSGGKASGREKPVGAIGDHSALGPVWFIVPGALLAIAILAPLAFVLRSWLRHRSIERRYREGRL